MSERRYPRLTVNAKAERMLRAGHPWVYGEETGPVTGPYQNGDLCDVYSEKGRYLGTGFINDQSKIRIRVISRNANDTFDEAFFERRLRWAIAYRQQVMREDFSACRLIFGEADAFPGLTVDRFGPILVTQTLSLGIEKRKTMLFSLLVRILREMGETVEAVYERNDVALREKEGMTQNTGFFTAPGLDLRTDVDPTVEITENGIRYRVDYREGQKTGYFLDQKYNRLAAARLAAGRRVLDCFTHTGAFALNAVAGGAAHVTAVDISADAIRQTKENAALNGFTDRMSFLEADVFDLLTAMADEKRCDYDYIILDPPAFTKSHDTVKSAYRGYREINRRAMQLLPRGGYLATCSCSHFMTGDLFRRMLAEAAADASVSLRQIECRQQGPDHPILWGVPETDYLKFYLFQIV